MITRNLVRGGTGWRLRGDRPSRLLLRAWINGQMHYEFPEDWQWRPVALTRQPSTAGRRWEGDRVDWMSAAGQWR